MNINSQETSSILFIDSGIGGLLTLCETIKKLPTNYIYFADNRYAPYGTKSDKFLRNRLSFIISKMLNKFTISTVVLACNTATTSSISFLRKQFPNLNIIGTEPALKVATDNHYNSPAILATPCTISHIELEKAKNFILLPDSQLASLIENRYISESPKNILSLKRKIYSIKNLVKECDCLVLGCTHYVFIKESLSKILKFPIIDGNFGVANQVYRFNNKKQANKISVKIILSKNNSGLVQKYKKILKQILAKQINLW